MNVRFLLCWIARLAASQLLLKHDVRLANLSSFANCQVDCTSCLKSIFFEPSSIGKLIVTHSIHFDMHESNAEAVEKTKFPMQPPI